MEILGQARKSLWIETVFTIHVDTIRWVRLVRACGSKQDTDGESSGRVPGQARKSLWIETYPHPKLRVIFRRGQARKSLWIETPIGLKSDDKSLVRLVRACGSKPTTKAIAAAIASGQARKSLWIETETTKKGKAGKMAVRLVRACGSKPMVQTQADNMKRVRLVRACGSKQLTIEAAEQGYGQARKSLWIETSNIIIAVYHGNWSGS